MNNAQKIVLLEEELSRARTHTRGRISVSGVKRELIGYFVDGGRLFACFTIFGTNAEVVPFECLEFDDEYYA